MFTETNHDVLLFNHGIQSESSDVRAHIGVLAKKLFVFPTVSALGVMCNFPARDAYQKGILGRTARGYLVPPSVIPSIRILEIDDEMLVDFTETLSTSEKGNRAVDIAVSIMKQGLFPFWVQGQIVKEVDMQVSGTDILVSGSWKIEVKCDYRASELAGIPNEKCTGNLFLQIAERNPCGHF